MAAVELLHALAAHPILRDLSLEALVVIGRYVNVLRNDILLVQEFAYIDLEHAPPALSEAQRAFFSSVLGIPLEVMGELWSLTKDYLWNLPATPLSAHDYDAFRVHGWHEQITAFSLYPPNKSCTNSLCPKQGATLREAFPTDIVVYTHSDGAQRGRHVRYYCRGCHTSYNNNYSVQDEERTYYSGTPQFLQVADHHYVETSLARMWRGQMYLGWFSATNAANLYHSCMMHANTELSEFGINLKPNLRTEHIWDAFTLLSLLEHMVRIGELLNVPHSGDQAQRFHKAMEKRNKAYIENGLPDVVDHVCDVCTRFFEDAKSKQIYYSQAIVGDGLSIGRPCCGEFRCGKPLVKIRDRFCAKHDHLQYECAVQGCKEPVVREKIGVDPLTGKDITRALKACDRPLHQGMLKKHEERSKGAFLMQERYQHARIAHPIDSVSTQSELSHQDVQEQFEFYVPSATDPTGVALVVEPNTGTVGVEDDSTVPCPSKSPAGNTVLKAQFGRRRTHNEQTLVRPCGLIFARATMFGAEAVSNFLIMTKNAFSVPGARKPQHIFYDTNCSARQQAEKDADQWFEGIGMCVDVWHFKNKHATTHEYCQLHCNPAQYKELIDENNNWFFNTSVAEQTNAWLGGYLSICREMIAVKYDFFLDEMIRLRNIDVLNKLHAAGASPRSYEDHWIPLPLQKV
ncbi:hypothetical protein BKA70DRAFT_1319560 [Coprinopsis sp. MPI-PUGE-AT-0042]|nr:hypothetical protein BKA70DRAFT_1319560 [Coprinopsis sp. MPI-PUGE-AT-0042]